MNINKKKLTKEEKEDVRIAIDQTLRKKSTFKNMLGTVIEVLVDPYKSSKVGRHTEKGIVIFEDDIKLTLFNGKYNFSVSKFDLYNGEAVVI